MLHLSYMTFLSTSSGLHQIHTQHNFLNRAFKYIYVCVYKNISATLVSLAGHIKQATQVQLPLEWVPQHPLQQQQW